MRKSLMLKQHPDCLAFISIDKPKADKLKRLVEHCRANFNDIVKIPWGGGILGPKAQAKEKKRQKELAKAVKID